MLTVSKFDFYLRAGNLFIKKITFRTITGLYLRLFSGLDDNINYSEMNQENNQNQPNSIQGQPSKTNVKTSKPPSSNPVPFRAYEAAEIYRVRKEFRMQKIKEEEERLRRHKAKPMPNFKAIHSSVMAVKETGKSCVVSPETPQVLRRGLDMKEKQKQKVLHCCCLTSKSVSKKLIDFPI